MKNKGITAAILIAIFLILGFWMLKKNTMDPLSPIVKNPQEEGGQPIPLTALTWQEYRNEEIGFSMSYPKELVESEFQIHPALTGKIFFGSLKLPSKNIVLIRSVTTDYTSETDSNWGRGFGFVKQGEDYYLKSLGGSLTKVDSTKQWPVNEGKNQALVTYAKDFSAKIREEFYAPGLLVTVNLPNEKFPTLGIESMQLDAQPLGQDEIDLIKQLVSSIKFIQ